MENQKVTFNQGIEVALDADVAAKIEVARAADEDQLRRVRTSIESMPTSQRRHAWDAYRLLIRARTDADNALSLATAIRAGDAELIVAVKLVIDEIKEVRVRQDRERGSHHRQPGRTESPTVESPKVTVLVHSDRT